MTHLVPSSPTWSCSIHHRQTSQWWVEEPSRGLSPEEGNKYPCLPKSFQQLPHCRRCSCSCLPTSASVAAMQLRIRLLARNCKLICLHYKENLLIYSSFYVKEIFKTTSQKSAIPKSLRLLLQLNSTRVWNSATMGNHSNDLMRQIFHPLHLYLFLLHGTEMCLHKTSSGSISWVQRIQFTFQIPECKQMFIIPSGKNKTHCLPNLHLQLLALNTEWEIVCTNGFFTPFWYEMCINKMWKIWDWNIG